MFKRESIRKYDNDCKWIGSTGILLKYSIITLMLYLEDFNIYNITPRKFQELQRRLRLLKFAVWNSNYIVLCKFIETFILCRKKYIQKRDLFSLYPVHAQTNMMKNKINFGMKVFHGDNNRNKNGPPSWNDNIYVEDTIMRFNWKVMSSHKLQKWNLLLIITIENYIILIYIYGIY